MNSADLLEAIADDLAVALEAIAAATVALSRLPTNEADDADCGRPLTDAEIAANPRHRAALARFRRIGRAYEAAEALVKARADAEGLPR